jgi:TonB family protein
MAFNLNSGGSLDSKLRLQAQSPGKRRSLHLGGASYQPDERDDNRVMRWAAITAVVLHVILFVVTFPNLSAQPREIQSASRRAYVVQEVRFQPPKPQQAQQIPQKKTRKIPIPDPTPDEPEPIVEEYEVEAPDLDVDELGDLFEIPQGPATAGVGPMWLDGSILPPEKVYAPQPRYTEEARKARIQGVVILQAVIDAVGNVTRVKILKGLPEGLAESAVETVEQWRFKPATLDGEPVPVYLNLTVSFSLQ